MVLSLFVLQLGVLVNNFSAALPLATTFQVARYFTQARKLLKQVSKMTFGSLIRRLARKHTSLITIV